MPCGAFRATEADPDRIWVAGMQQESGKAGKGLFADRSAAVIGASIEVHRTLGPGLLESVYEQCLCIELERRGIRFQRQKVLPVIYKGQPINAFYRIDVVVDDNLVVEAKAVESLTKVHETQLLTYLKLSGIQAGLLINFNAPLLRGDALRRLSLNPQNFPLSRFPVASPPSRHE